MEAERLALPKAGTPWTRLETQLEAAKVNDVDWRSGRAPAFIHFAGEDVLDVAKRASFSPSRRHAIGQPLQSGAPASRTSCWR
jgi:hypothetical protein